MTTAPTRPLTPAQRALLDQRLRGLAPTAAPASRPVPAPPSAENNADAPLSFGQERLWVHEQLNPGVPLYTTGAALRIAGHLDPDLLGRCLDALVARHDVLRTRFVQRAGQVRQVVAGTGSADYAVDDLRSVPDAESLAAQRLRADHLATFDLGRDALLRARLLLLPDATTILSLTAHHIVVDAWSIQVAFTELASTYAALEAGRPADGVAPPVQFHQFARAERARWTPRRLADEGARESARLGGAPSALRLPRRGGATRPERGPGSALLGEVLGPRVADLVRRVARAQRATPLTPLVAAFGITLSRFAAESDLLIGLPVSGRDDPALGGAIGFFSNTAALRLRLDPGLTVDGLLRAVRADAVAAMSAQRLPFSQLVDVLRVGGGQSPLHAVFGTAPEDGVDGGRFAGRPATAYQVDVAHVAFDLNLQVVQRPDSLVPVWGYDDSVFTETTVRALARAYRRALVALADPDRLVAAIDLVDEEDRRLLLAGWNPVPATTECEPADLHGLIEARVAAGPDRPAVDVAGQILTYGELDRRANRLARLLRSRGVGDGDPVAVCLRRGLDLPVATLAVLKARATLVPLDPDYPAERLAYQLTDSGATLVLTDAATAPTLGSAGGAVGTHGAASTAGTAATAGTASTASTVVAVDQLDLTADTWPDAPLHLRAQPDSLAYIVYTSGSTGRPKGGMNTHRGSVIVVREAARRIGVTSDDRLLQRMPVGFDMALFELFLALGTGATLVVVDPDRGNDAAHVVEVIADQRVSVVTTVPSFLKALVDVPAFADCTNVAAVVTGGETLPAELATRFQRRRPGTALVNVYGPSETAIMLSYWRCPPGLADGAVLLGPVSPQTRALVLDEGMRLVPVGAIGELYLGGSQLGRGYLGRPGLTAQRYLPDPYGPPGERLYRTGDLVRQWPSGDLEFVGRADHQVKIRGYRVEPEEIEEVLRQHPSVTAVAVVPTTRAGQATLVAFVETIDATDAPASVEGLRAHLRRLLPPAMVPEQLLVVAALPLNPHGKVDRSALARAAAEAIAADPVGGAADPAGEPTAPRDDVEQGLVRLWSAALGGRPVGIDDNFFDLGGNSLLAIGVIGRIAQAFDVSLPVSVLFDAPTVAELARRVREQGSGRPPVLPRSLVQLRRGAAAPALVLVHPVGGSVFCYRELAGLLTDRAVFAFASPPTVPATVTAMAQRYLDELLAFGPPRPYVLGGWSMGGAVAVELARLLHERTGATPPVLIIDAATPTELAAPTFTALESFVYDFARLLGAAPPPVPMADRPVDQVLAEVVTALDARVEISVLRERYQAFADNAAALARHELARYPGPVYYAAADGNADGEHAADEHADGRSADGEAWRPYAAALHVSRIHGDHYGVITGAGARTLAELVRSITEE